jgi:hypothetical protein
VRILRPDEGPIADCEDAQSGDISAGSNLSQTTLDVRSVSSVSSASAVGATNPESPTGSATGLRAPSEVTTTVAVSTTTAATSTTIITTTTQPAPIPTIAPTLPVPTVPIATVPAPTVLVDPCPVKLYVTVPGWPGQSTLYTVSLSPDLIGDRIRLIVDDSYTLDTQYARSTLENLAWQPGDPQPSASAVGVVAVVDTGDGTPQFSSCAIPPGVSTSQLTPEQTDRATDVGALAIFQSALDGNVGTTGVPRAGYGDTVRSVALPSGSHTILIAYQRNRCVANQTCSSSARLDPNGVETTSLFCVDAAGTKFKLVGSAALGGKRLDAYLAWPTVAQVASDFSSWCQ